MESSTRLLSFSYTKKQIGLIKSKVIIAVLLSIITLVSSNLFAQLAPVSPPTGGFAIDGGLKANTPTTPSPFAANQGDWFPGTGGTGGSVFNITGNSFVADNPSRSGWSTDPYNSNDNIFTNGSKFNDYISSLSWFTNSAPDKNDINNALYHVARNQANNDQWVFISGDRLSTNGTSYIDFEFLQGTVTKTGTTSGGFTGTPAEGKNSGGGRTENDMVISMEYTNGGSKPNVYIYQWKKSGNTWSYQQVPVTSTLLENAFAETNRTGAETGVPYSTFGTNTYQQYSFVEAAINITYLLQQGGAACAGLNIQTLWVKTKASASSTAALKDFMDPIPVSFQFGSTQLTLPGPKCVSDNTAYPLTANIPGTFSGPGVTGNLTDGYVFTPSAAGGVGTKTINFTSADGSCTNSGTIDVVANPAVYTLSGNSICASAPNTGTISLSNSQTGVSYQLKKAADNSNVQTAKSGTTGTGLQWTGLPAGVSYYVLATGATPTSCTSQTDPASVTEVANPAVYTLSGNSICASAPNTGTISLSNSQTGVSYQLKKAADNSNVQTAKSGTTGTGLQWTGLPAGVSYYVLATGATPTSCTSQTDPASVTEVANPAVYTLSGNSICASAPNTGTISLSNSQTGVSYQLKKAADNSNVQTAKSGTTGTGLQWTGLPAGVSYYVLATGATPTSCTSQTDPASVTEVANPAVYTLSGNSICASAPNTGTISLSNSQTGVSYQLKKAADNSNVQTAKSGTTGTGLQWTGLPAGVSYYVLATGATPTSCTSQTSNASISETANPTMPAVSYVPPTCTQTTFKVEIASPTAGTYTLHQLSGGVATATKVYPTDAVGGKIVFDGLTVGKGYRVTLTVGDCVSLPESCGDFSAINDYVARAGGSSTQTQEITLDAPKSKPSVVAAPNPFNDRIKFSLKSTVSGQGSLELYNMMGQKVKTVFQGQVTAGQVQTIEYSVPGAQRSSLIYVFRVGTESTSGKLIGLKQ